MSRRILIVVSHPDPSPDRLCRGLADAEKAGHAVRRVDLAALDYPMLRTMQEFEHGAVPDELKNAAEAIVWAGHIVFVFPPYGSEPCQLCSRHSWNR
jgi:putative NADPH-quinone reductase